MKTVFHIMFLSQLLLALLCSANKAENSNVKKRQETSNSGRNILQHNKPNILIILADDVGTSDIPYWGDNIVPMENIQKLQSQGVTFMDAHASPLCAPSRYMLLSGNYPHRGVLRNGSWNFKAGQNQFINNQKSIAQVLKDQLNYHTGMYGKWHIGGRVPAGGTFSNDKQRPLSCCNIDWNKPMEDCPNDMGFDESFYTMSGIQSAPYSFFRNGHLETNIDDIKFWWKGTYATVNKNGESIIAKAGEGDPNWDSTEYNTRLVKEVDDFLEDHDTKDPFFLYVGLGQVHAPHSPPKYYIDGTPVAGTFSHPHLDMLYEMDLVVGSMISSIEDRGLMNNTLIIFTSDNGGLVHFGHRDEFGRHFRGGKNTIWEGGHTVPMIMRYDGIIPADEKRTGLVGLNDLYATLGDFAGFDIPDGSAQDSISFANHAKSEQSASGREYYGIWIWDKQSQSQAIRYGQYKYVITHTSPKEEYLFNLKSDVKEERNLLREDSWFYNNLKQHLSSKLRQIGVCPLDVEGHFELLTAQPDHGMNVTCKYFVEDDGTRCETIILGEIKCNSVCGRFRDSCRLYKDSGEKPYYPDRFLSQEPSLNPGPTASLQPSQFPSTSHSPSLSSEPSMLKSFEPSFLPSLEPSSSSSSFS